MRGRQGPEWASEALVSCVHLCTKGSREVRDVRCSEENGLEGERGRGMGLAACGWRGKTRKEGEKQAYRKGWNGRGEGRSRVSPGFLLGCLGRWGGGGVPLLGGRRWRTGVGEV